MPHQPVNSSTTTMKTKSAQQLQDEIALIRLAYRNRTEPLNHRSTYGRLHQIRPVPPLLFLAVYGTSGLIIFAIVAALLTF